MAAIFEHSALDALSRPQAAPLGRALMEIAVLVAAWETRARTRKDLATLDPDRLYDIGLTRAEALTEADKPFWRP